MIPQSAYSSLGNDGGNIKTQDEVVKNIRIMGDILSSHGRQLDDSAEDMEDYRDRIQAVEDRITALESRAMKIEAKISIGLDDLESMMKENVGPPENRMDAIRRLAQSIHALAVEIGALSSTQP